MTGRLAQADALKAHGPPGRPDGQTPSPGVLGTLGPSVTPTNLLYSVVPRHPARCTGTGGRARPRWPAWSGAHRQDRARRHRRIGHPRRAAAGVRRVFDLVVAAVPLPLDTWLTLTRPARQDDPEPPGPAIPAPALMALAAVVERGGIYGIGGGAFLAPVLVGSGRKPVRGRPRRPGYSMTPRTTLPCLPRAALRMNAAWAWASGKTQSISGRRSPVPASGPARAAVHGWARRRSSGRQVPRRRSSRSGLPARRSAPVLGLPRCRIAGRTTLPPPPAPHPGCGRAARPYARHHRAPP